MNAPKAEAPKPEPVGLLGRIKAREARFDYTRPVRFPARDLTDWSARA